ncbi:hypothetical protein KY345_06550 [Candidatus Woesearchaeota archaeon]|nr:hypothetical protein [Candidatus Woesearchaeota archaeon]
MDNTFKYRILVEQGSVDDRCVQEIAQREIGKRIEVLNWSIERTIDHEKYVSGGPGCSAGAGTIPSSIEVVTLNYRFNDK